MDLKQKKELEAARKAFLAESGGKVDEVSGQINFHSFEEKPFVRGTFCGFKKFTGGKFGEQNLPLLEIDGEVNFLPGHATLIQKCEQLKVGDEVFIELTDEEVETKNGNAKVYNVIRMKK